MKLPESAIVGPYTVTFRNDPEACGVSNCTGQYLEDDLVVMFDGGRPDDVVRDTILHELLHAVWAQAGLNGTVDSVAEDSNGEKVIRALTPRLIQLLRDNPWLVRMVTRGSR